MEEVSICHISCHKMMKIVKNYYKNQGKEVKVKQIPKYITNDLDKKILSNIKVCEKISIFKVNNTFEKKLSFDDLTNILNDFLKDEDMQVVSFGKYASNDCFIVKVNDSRHENVKKILKK